MNNNPHAVGKRNGVSVEIRFQNYDDIFIDEIYIKLKNVH